MEIATYEITLRHAGLEPIRFAAPADRSIVKSARAAGYALTTGCLQGRCAICRSRLLAGELKVIRRPSRHAVGDPLKRADGCVLPCSLAPDSDVELETLSPWTSC